MKLPAEIKLKSSSFASFLQDERNAKGLYVLKLVLSACFNIFCLINFMDFNKRKKPPDKNLYLVFLFFHFLASRAEHVCVRKQPPLEVEPISSCACLRDFLGTVYIQKFENFKPNKLVLTLSPSEILKKALKVYFFCTSEGTRIVLQMEISSSLFLYIYCNNKCFHFNLQERFWVDEGSTKTLPVMGVLKSESFLSSNSRGRIAQGN